MYNIDDCRNSGSLGKTASQYGYHVTNITCINGKFN